MPYFTYNQNNSGGHFESDPIAGITHYVIIEAEKAEEADSRAESIGLYFNGCANGTDCDCCGDRWCRSYPSDTKPTPRVYGEEAVNFVKTMFSGSFPNVPSEVVIHPLNGPFTFVIPSSP